MAERTVSVRLRAQTEAYVKGIKDAHRATADFATATVDYGKRHKAALDDVAKTAGIAGAALLGASVVTVRSFANFDQAMDSVQAATRESAENMDRLREAALDAGERTVFSATESAGAIENLAKAGVSAADILGGALDGALDLAAAGGLEVADAAEIAATAMTQFKLAGQDVPHIADLLAAGAGKAQGDVTDLAYALKQSGLVASQFGLSIEETTGTLAAFASAGLLGSDAGTSFRTMLLRLANPADETKDAMRDLGIAAYDAQGNFVGIGGLAQQLQDRLGGLTQATRDQALAQIFGTDAIRAANVLYQQGAQGVAEWTAKVDDAGFAAETAAIRMDNLKGDIEQFMGALETAFIGAGEGGNGPLRTLTQRATELVNEFNELPGPVKQATTLIAGGGGLALLGVAGMAKLVSMVGKAHSTFVDLNREGTKTAGIMRGLVKGAGILAVGAVADTVLDSIQRMNGSLIESSDLMADLSTFGRTGQLAGGLDDFAASVDELGAKVRIAASDTSNWFINIIEGQSSSAVKSVKEIDAALAQIGRIDQGRADEIFRRLRDAAIGAGASVEDVNRLFPKYNEQVERSAAATEDAGGAQDYMRAAMDDATASIVEQRDSIEELFEETRTLADGFLGLRDAERQFQGAADDVTDIFKKRAQVQRDIAKAQKELADADSKSERSRLQERIANLRGELADYSLTLDVNTEAGRRNEAALDAVADAANEQIEALLGQGKVDEANAKQREHREVLEGLARQFGLTKTEAQKYVTDALAKIPAHVDTEATFNSAKAQAALDQWITAVGNARYQLDAGATGLLTGTDLLDAQTLVGAKVTTRKADGGLITVGSGPRADDVHLMASRGEYVVNSQATAMYKPLLDAINNLSLATSASGGGINMGTVNVSANDAAALLRSLQEYARLQSLGGLN